MMSPSQSVKVFFEPRIVPHDPALYAFDRTDEGVSPDAAAADEALARYRDQGFLMVRGLLTPAEVAAGRAELEALALDDSPDCEMIWYEGALRDHLRLDAARDREIDGKLSGIGFAAGQEGKGVPRLDPALRARHVRKFMGFVGRQPSLTALARHEAVMALVRRMLGGAEPALFQDMALVKPAGGREKPWHQDHAYFNVALDTPIVGIWIPFGTVTPENGCMHMLAGGHGAGPRLHFKRRDWQICDGDVDGAGRGAGPRRAGGGRFVDGKIPHGTPTNQTDEFRWAVQFHYRPTAALAIDDAVRLAAFGSEGKDVTC